MNVKSKMNNKFRDLDGGLFGDVTKADVGSGVQSLIERGVDIMAWADPFFPDPSLPESVKKVMQKEIDKGMISHYSMPIGDKTLRDTLARKISEKTGLEIHPDRHVIVTPGSDAALIYAMMPFLEDGDEVLIPNPSYPSNFLNPKLLGAKAVGVPLDKDNNNAFDIREFEKRVTNQTKMVLISHPNNPTTTVFRKENIIELCDFIKKYDLILVSDQAFEDHIFDGIEFVHPATIEGMWERTLTVCSISKGIGLSGFRIGYIFADDHIMDVLYGAAVNVLGAASTLSSIAAVTALEDKEHMVFMYNKLEKRRNLAYEAFNNIKGVFLKKSESSFLTWLNIEALGTSSEVAAYILQEANVLVNEGYFYGSEGEGYIRIVTGCFYDDEKAVEVFTRIRNALIKLGNEKSNRK